MKQLLALIFFLYATIEMATAQTSEPVLDNHITISEAFQIVDDQVRSIMLNTEQSTFRINNIEDNLNIYKLRINGQTKILSGIGLQIIALGILTVSEIENTTVVNVITRYSVPIKTSTVDFNVNDLAPVVEEYNKTPFYVSAGILTSAGIILEVLGIIDIHKANVYITQNSVGIALKF